MIAGTENALTFGNFFSDFHLFWCKGDSLAIELTKKKKKKKKKKKIEVNFIHSYDIHFNSQPTTVNALNNLIQCYHNFTSILEPTYRSNL